MYRHLLKLTSKTRRCLSTRNVHVRTHLRVSVRLSSSWAIHPSIGIARLGNALTNHYDAPTTIGGMPTESGQPIKTFRNLERILDEEEYEEKRVRRQAAKFIIYDKETGQQVGADEIESIEWKVWLANKKAGFFNFNELAGNPLLDKYTQEKFGRDNNYDDTSLRNASVEGTDRKKLIIDFGPRTASIKGEKVRFDSFSAKEMGYAYSDPEKAFEELAAFQGKSLDGHIDYLGEIEMNEDYSLSVLGGLGKSVGSSTIGSFAGADGYWDDISDGPVTATIKKKDGTEIVLEAWCLVGSPKYAPELVSITTWSDVVYDMAVRYKQGFNPRMVSYDTNNKFKLGKDGFYPCISRDIKPIMDRMRNYIWTANVAPMVTYSSPPFDIYDTSQSAELITKKQKWFSFLRNAFDLETKEANWPLMETLESHSQLLRDPKDPDYNYPLMPLGAGDNPVMDNKYHNISGRSPSQHRKEIISKFLTLSPVQYYMLYQWANGYCTDDSSDERSQLCDPKFSLNALDQASIGNCVGFPASPGIETTWNARNPSIYQLENNDPYRIKIRYDGDIDKLKAIGLSPEYDECRQNEGCEPGDLTKRMAIPWQADFANCSVQTINFSDAEWVRGEDKKPAYFAYWWPAQAPWDVYLGYETKKLQKQPNFGTFGEEGSGKQVPFQRGIQSQANPYASMIAHWKDLGFIKNDSGDLDYPYFVETERNFEEFEQSVAEKARDLFETVQDGMN